MKSTSAIHEISKSEVESLLTQIGYELNNRFQVLKDRGSVNSDTSVVKPPLTFYLRSVFVCLKLTNK